MRKLKKPDNAAAPGDFLSRSSRSPNNCAYDYVGDYKTSSVSSDWFEKIESNEGGRSMRIPHQVAGIKRKAENSLVHVNMATTTVTNNSIPRLTAGAFVLPEDVNESKRHIIAPMRASDIARKADQYVKSQVNQSLVTPSINCHSIGKTTKLIVGKTESNSSIDIDAGINYLHVA